MDRSRNDRQPSLTELSKALRKTTELLLSELAQPSAVAPEWSDLEWDIARAVAAMQGIGMLLSRRLQWHGPARWQSFLAGQRAQNLLRDQRVGAVLAQIDAGTRSAGIRVVALKGSALRALGLYEPGDRPMADIDLLARRQDFTAVAHALASIGYRELFTTARHAVFSNCAPAAAVHIGEHIDNPLKIELHERIADALPYTPVDITARLWPRDTTPGLNGYASRSALLAHLALHAAGNMRAHALRAIQIQDIALLAARLSDGDWQEFMAPRADAAAPGWAFPPLDLARRYFDARVPQPVLTHLRKACPPWLAHASARYRMTDVSWSNLHISAFPGIEWSRSAGEALRFAMSRLAPGVQARAELVLFAGSQPQFDAIPWYRVPHRSRILRWLAGRAPRVQTLWSVQRALAREGS